MVFNVHALSVFIWIEVYAFYTWQRTGFYPVTQLSGPQKKELEQSSQIKNIWLIFCNLFSFNMRSMLVEIYSLKLACEIELNILE